MTDILCEWLNNDLGITQKIENDSITRSFSNGYLIGEVLSRYQLQDDFEEFSQNITADAKLNNFTRLEPTLQLLGVPIDTNIARDVMTEKPGVVTRLLYQLFIALENKKKANLTGVAMDTMRPAAPKKLLQMESIIYKDRLKQVTPRQTDLNLQEIVNRFHQHQQRLEERALKQRVESADGKKQAANQHRLDRIERSRQVQLKQSELMAKIESAVVHIPKPPPNKTAQAMQSKKQMKIDAEAMRAMRDLDMFEDRLRRALPGGGAAQEDPDSGMDVGDEEEEDGEAGPKPGRKAGPTSRDLLEYIKPASNDDYIGRIRRRLEEDGHARSEREKRRRKVLVNCLSAHFEQEESKREEIIASRLMRQSQMERRIAIQLLQARHEKEVLIRNRTERENQYQNMREVEFEEAMEREKEIARQAHIAFIEQLQADEVLHDQLKRERLERKYTKHYEFCSSVAGLMSDFAVRVAQYREYTQQKVPDKLFREWRALFVAGLPLFDESTKDDVDEAEDAEKEVVADVKAKILDESELTEYRTMSGEWLAPEEIIPGPPKPNPIVGWVVDRLYALVRPPTPPPEAPKLPSFPVKAAILGKAFSGKSAIIKKLMEHNRCISLELAPLMEEAMEAFKNNEEAEEEPEPTPEPETTPGPGTADASNITGLSDLGPLPTLSEAQAPANTPPTVDTLECTSGQNVPLLAVQASTPLLASTQEQSSAVMSDKPKLSERAKVGERLLAALKKGKVVDDQLLVDCFTEAIKRVPDGTGWILDGFPSTYNQAKLLEKALTGHEEPKTPEQTKGKRGKGLAVNPRPQPPPPEPKSGLDVIVLLEADEKLSLFRAAGRTKAPAGDKEFHYHNKPPPEGSATGVGPVEMVVPVEDLAHDMEQLQHRLTTFIESFPKLAKFYGRWNLIKKIPADQPPEALFLEVERLLDEAIQRKRDEETARETMVVEAVSEVPPVEEKPAEPAPPAEEPPPQPPASPPSSKKGSKKGSRAGSAKKGSPRSRSGGSRSGSAGSDKKGAKEKKEKAPTDDKKKKSGSRGSSPKSPRGGSRSGSRGSKKGKGKKASPEPVPEPAPETPTEPTGPPPPEPGSEDWQFVDIPVPQELAGALLPLWDTIEGTYLENLMTGFRQLRDERENIIHYYYRVRRDFLDYLRRPDSKQEHVTQFQKDFNEVPDDLRGDEDMLCDLHQRVDELRDRLFDMSDERKEAAEKRRNDVMAAGWLEDRMGLLSNNYIGLMQAEFNRFQDTMRFLKEYYKAMDLPIPDEFKPDFLRLPLLELPTEKVEGSGKDESVAEVEKPPEKAASPPAKKAKAKGGDAAAEQEIHILTNEEIEAMFKTRIPLLPPKPSAADIAAAIASSAPTGAVGKSGKDKAKGGKEKKTDRGVDTPPPPSDPDERLLYDAYWNGVQILLNFMANEQAQREADEEAERQRLAEKEKEKLGGGKDAKGGKEAKGGAKGGKGGKKSRSPSPKKSGAPAKDKPKADDAASTPEPLETEEERQKRETKERMRKEYFAALEHEAQGARLRMELVKIVGCAVIQDLKKKADNLHKDMFDWIGARMLKENESIEQLTEILRFAIEVKEKLHEIIEIKGDDIFLNADLSTAEPGVIPLRPSPIEHVDTDQFKVKQIVTIYKKLRTVAPAGLLSITEFVQFFHDLALLSQEADALPEPWRQPTNLPLTELAEALSTDREYVNWRSFLLGISRPFPWPNQSQLLETLVRLKDLDQLETGTVTREQFDFIDLWFSGASTPPGTPQDPLEPKVIDRLSQVKKLFFDFFLESKDVPKEEEDTDTPDPHTPERIQYEPMLFAFCASPSPYVGFLRALSVAVGSHVPHVSLKDFEAETMVDPQAEGIPEDLEDVLVPVEALHKVLTFGRQSSKEKPPNETGGGEGEANDDRKDVLSMESLASLYQQLGSENQEPLNFSRLIEHSFIVEIILKTKQYKLVDLRAFVTDPGDSHSVRTDTVS